MWKLINWCKENILFISTLFLLAFIPLYPKLPLLNIQNTWVYVRLEDFFVFGALIIWIILMSKKRVSLNTPLTSSIFLFWMIGGIATVHGVLLIFPTISNVFPNVALFSFIRRIEYMSIFFISYWGIRDKKQVTIVLYALLLTVLCISVYGLGQRYLGFPAYLTMNEEFAKGIPLTLSKLSRIPSTFGGHYDLAAYLVLVLPILISMMFSGISPFVIPVICFVIALGSYVLVLTVSRISLVGLIVAAGLVILFYTRKLFVYLLPLIVCFAALILYVSPNITSRFASTLSAVDILIDANTGSPIGKISFVPNTYFIDKTIRQQNFTSPQDYVVRHESMDPTSQIASISGVIIPYTQIPNSAPLMQSTIISTGEDLPQGTGYVNLPLSPIVRRLNNFYYEIHTKDSSKPVEVQVINGPYLIKKSLAYDLSYTTRFQGEWPHALAAFKRNIFLGSGYGSVSLAVDNSYLRMLAEIGMFGTIAFLGIFVLFGAYVIKQYSSIESPLVKSLLIGLSAGILGLCINALFIDVFEASKVAFSLWLLLGVSLGSLKSKTIHQISEKWDIQKILAHPMTGVLAILIIGYTLYGSITTNYFQGDDFVWLHWAATCSNPSPLGKCPIEGSHIVEYFTRADGFFYRPGTKIFFYVMQATAWLNPSSYHTSSLILHLVISVLVFVLLRLIFTNSMKAIVGSLLFVIIAGYSESVIWISAIGLLFTTFFSLVSIFLGSVWYKTGSKLSLISTFISILCATTFHEMGIVAPFIVGAYIYVFLYTGTVRSFITQRRVWLLILPILIYLLARFTAGSHWFNGDYSYNVFKLPFNVLGNAFGYFASIIGGPQAMTFVTILRIQLRSHLFISSMFAALTLFGIYHAFRNIFRVWSYEEKRIFLFGFLFFIISLIPFLGLGNISNRYGYMATIGVVIMLVVCVQRLYEFMQVNGEDIARYSLVVVASMFLLFQLVQRNKMLDNWQESGEKVRRSVISMNAGYTDAWSTLPMEFHIVNLPIKNGFAWMYPVGFPDMMWFITKNDSIRIFYESSVSSALDTVEYGSKTQMVFEFNEKGELIQKFKEWRTQ